MGKKKGKSRDDHLQKATIEAAGHRLLAAKAFFSGEVERYRKKRIEEGDVPWRIIRYQRIIDPERTPIPLAFASYTTPKSFEKHLRFLTSECKVLALAELIRMIEADEEIPERAVVLTFDGGHMDNMIYAFPLLLKYGVPATIFVCTGYIETSHFLIEDRFALALQAFRKMDLSIPRFSFLEDWVYEGLDAIAPGLKVTDDSFNFFLAAMRSVTEHERQTAIRGLGKILADLSPPPYIEDFMRWDDVRKMQQHGITFGLMGHWHFPAPELDRDAYLKNISDGFNKLREESIVIERSICFPQGVFSGATIEHLGEIKVPYAIGIGDFAHPKLQEHRPRVLGRVVMCESASFCRELFACHLWNYRTLGIAF